MKTIALIPARKGSKRIKDKNIVELGGKPLLAHSIIAAQACDLIDEVWVSTDSPAYMIIAKNEGAQVAMRPREFALDSSGDFEVINHLIEYDGPLGYDLIAYLRPTTPYRALYHLEEAIKLMVKSYESVDSLRSVEEMPESVEKMFRLNLGGFLAPIVGDSMENTGKPNQECFRSFKGNGYIDLIKPSYARETGKLWGRCIGYITPRTIEIDTPEDLQYAEWFAWKRGGLGELWRSF